MKFAWPLCSILGYPRLGPRGELRDYLTSYWRGRISEEVLEEKCRLFRENTYRHLIALGLGADDYSIPESFSYYDHVLDAAVHVGAIPARFSWLLKDGLVDLKAYFTLARGGYSLAPLESSRYFGSMYHHLVPEVDSDTHFSLTSHRIIEQFQQAKQVGMNIRPTILGPVSLLMLSKSPCVVDSNSVDKDGSVAPIERLSDLLPIYSELLERLYSAGCDLVQIDEPAVTDNRFGIRKSQKLLVSAYDFLSLPKLRPRILVSMSYGNAVDQVDALTDTEVEALGFNLIDGAVPVANPSLRHKALFGGVIDGSNVWRGNLSVAQYKLQRLRELSRHVVACTSTSLFHLPHTIQDELCGDKLHRDTLSSDSADEDRFESRVDPVSEIGNMPGVGNALREPGGPSALSVNNPPVKQSSEKHLPGEEKPGLPLTFIKERLAFADEKVQQVVSLAEVLRTRHSKRSHTMQPDYSTHESAAQHITGVFDGEVREVLDALDESDFCRELRNGSQLCLPVLPIVCMCCKLGDTGHSSGFPVSQFTVSQFAPEKIGVSTRSQLCHSQEFVTQIDTVRSSEMHNSDKYTTESELDADIGDGAGIIRAHELLREALDSQKDMEILAMPREFDPIEHFALHLTGFFITQNGWVQVLGEQCRRPPILWGDIAPNNRQQSKVTRDKYTYLVHSLTDKPVKQALPGVFTVLMSCFVRNDQPFQDTAKQMAIAVRDEVNNLQRVGVKVVQIDEPALEDFLSLDDTARYWATQVFRLATSSALPDTQLYVNLRWPKCALPEGIKGPGQSALYDRFTAVNLSGRIAEILGIVNALDADVVSFELVPGCLPYAGFLSGIKSCASLCLFVHDSYFARVPTLDECSQLVDSIINLPGVFPLVNDTDIAGNDTASGDATQQVTVPSQTDCANTKIVDPGLVHNKQMHLPRMTGSISAGNIQIGIALSDSGLDAFRCDSLCIRSSYIRDKMHFVKNMTQAILHARRRCVGQNAE